MSKIIIIFKILVFLVIIAITILYFASTYTFRNKSFKNNEGVNFYKNLDNGNLINKVKFKHQQSSATINTYLYINEHYEITRMEAYEKLINELKYEYTERNRDNNKEYFDQSI